MKPGLREWDAAVITDLFNERDQNLISGIPLSHNQEDDIRYWWQENSGSYTVKSAFKLVQILKGDWVSDASSGFWRRLWNLKIPPKVRNFLWRACNDFLPSKAALLSKYVQVSHLCPLCSTGLETTLHCLVMCNYAKECLQSSGIINATHVSVTFTDWLQNIMCHHSNLTLSKVAMLLWSIWKARNLVVWQNTYMHVDEVVRTAHSTLDQWLEAQLKNFVPSVVSLNPMDGKELWTKPEVHKIKINVDAALFTSANKYGYAFVSRDHSGKLIMAKTVCCLGVVAADLAEAIAFKEALSWIKSKDWNNIVLETDCARN